jgi:hypothetical protein
MGRVEPSSETLGTRLAILRIVVLHVTGEFAFPRGVKLLMRQP